MRLDSLTLNLQHSSNDMRSTPNAPRTKWTSSESACRTRDSGIMSDRTTWDNNTTVERNRDGRIIVIDKESGDVC